MRITCHTIEAFIANLKMGDIFEHTVWVDQTKREINEQKYVVNLQASAVLVFPSGGESLLQYGEDCGADLLDGDPDRSGSEIADVKRKKLVEYCDDVGLKVRSGLVDV